MNSGGVRIGTAELYRVIENMNEISESLAVERQYSNDTEIILFVVLNKNYNLEDEIKNKIIFNIKNSLSPKHVPTKIYSVSEIPKTRSGKIVELLIKSINFAIENKEILTNPHCLKEYQNIYNSLNKNAKRIVVSKLSPDVLKYEDYTLPNEFQVQWLEYVKLHWFKLY